MTRMIIAAAAVLLLSACAPETEDTDAASSESADPPVQLEGETMPVGDLPRAQRYEYPMTEKGEQTDVYHGTKVADPYRWLEEDVRESERVAEWVEAQNQVTFGYLETIEERERIRERLAQLWDYEKFGTPFKAGGQYFYFHNNGLQNQNVLYMQDSLGGEAQLVVDPNTWSEDGTVALADVEISPDARYAAMAVQDGGSDWRIVKVLDITTGKELDDQVQWVKFSPISWAQDSAGFYYSRYPAPEEGEQFQGLNHNHQVWFHAIGTTQENDRLVFANEDHPDWGYAPEVTDDGRYLVITIWKGTDDRYQVAYLDLSQPDAEPVMLIEGFENDYSFIGNEGSRFYFRTNKDAPRGRLIAIDASDPDAGLEEIVPQRDAVLRGASLVGGHFVAGYLKDARSQVVVYATDGDQVREVDLPGIGSASGFGGKADDPQTFYTFSSYNVPPTTYVYDVASGESSIFKQADVDFKPEDYVVDQVFYTSADGTRVPMFIAHRKGLEKTGETPTLLYGYGGFNIALTPAFSVTNLAWMELGGIYAVANIRGGGEYGEAWHKAGTRLQKQNVFDDFIAAAEHLIEQRYTNPDKLAVFGGSNGGLLVGAVVNQRPELFAAAIPAVGVMDMLRFHQFTAGRFWVDDYGSAEDPEEFEALYAYSPYHNLKQGVDYPAVMVTTADTDDRVVPAHSFKYAAALQAAHAGEDPVLIRIETRAGHGAGKPTDKIIEEYADRWAFLVDNLDVRLPEGYGPTAAD